MVADATQTPREKLSKKMQAKLKKAGPVKRGRLKRVATAKDSTFSERWNQHMYGSSPGRHKEYTFRKAKASRNTETKRKTK